MCSFWTPDHGWAIWGQETSVLIQSDDNGRTWRRAQSQPSSAAGFLDAARFLSMTSGIAFLGPVEAAGGIRGVFLP